MSGSLSCTLVHTWCPATCCCRHMKEDAPTRSRPAPCSAFGLISGRQKALENAAPWCGSPLIMLLNGLDVCHYGPAIKFASSQSAA